MAEDKQQEPTSSSSGLEFAEGYERYLDALVSAYSELDDIAKTEKELAYRKAKLNDTVEALKPLVFKYQWDINTLGLSNAIRFVFKNTRRFLSAADVRTKLIDLGFELDRFDNPLASIHTALNRMKETDELRLIPTDDDDGKKRFEPGPELKPPPEPKEESNVAQILAALGTEAAKEKK